MHIQQMMTDRSELLVRKLQFHLPPTRKKRQVRKITGLHRRSASGCGGLRRPPRPWRRPPTPPISFRMWRVEKATTTMEATSYTADPPISFGMWREKFAATRYVIRLRIHEQPRNKGWVMSPDYVCTIPSQGRQLKRWGRQLKTEDMLQKRTRDST